MSYSWPTENCEIYYTHNTLTTHKTAFISKFKAFFKNTKKEKRLKLTYFCIERAYRQCTPKKLFF